MNIKDVKYFKDCLIASLEAKTSWGKNELILHIKDVYTEILEKEEERRERCGREEQE